MKADKNAIKAMVELETLDSTKKTNNEREKKVKDYLLKKMEEDFVKEYTYDDGQAKMLSVVAAERKSIDFDLDKLFKKLTQKQKDVIMAKTYSVDMDKLKVILKKHPEIKSKIKDAIIVNKHIDQERFDNAINNGFITKKDVDGCYTKKTTRYIKMSRKKKPKE